MKSSRKAGQAKHQRSGATQAPPAAPEARDGAKAPDAREAARLATAAWQGAIQAHGAKIDEHIDGIPDDRAKAVKSSHWCGEAPGYNAAVGELLPLVTRFAQMAQNEDDESCLVASRAIQALVGYLELPRDRRNETRRRGAVNKVISTLGSQAGIPEDRFPRLLKFKHKAEEALAEVVGYALEAGKNAAEIAFAIETVREPLAHLGTKKILPSEGTTAVERIALSTEAIEELRQNTDGGKLHDAKALVRKIARAAGYHGKLFEAADRARRRRS